MNDPIKKVEQNPTPEGYSPKDNPGILDVAEENAEKQTNSTFMRKNSVELIILNEDVKIVGISFNKCKETDSVVYNSKFDMYGNDTWDKLNEVIGTKQPETDYAVWANNDLIIGRGVTDIDGQDDFYVTTIIPAGRYLKVSWNAETFEELVMEAMGGSGADEFLEKNNLEKDRNGFYIEVYPKDTIGKYVRPITSYPEMYNLFSVKEKE